MRLALALSALCLVCSATSNARAETPAGEYTISVGGDAGLAFPSGVAELCEMTSEGEVCATSDVATDGSGAVTGAAALTIESVSAEIDLALTGQISGSTLKPKTVLDFVATGTAVGFDLQGSGRMRCRLSRQAPVGMQLCKGKARLCIFDAGGQQLDCARLPIITVLQLARVPFDVVLDLSTDERNAVTSQAAAVVVDVEGAPSVPYTAKGRYSPNADTVNLKLKSVDPALKSTVQLKKLELEEGGAVSGAVAFKVAGQKGKALLPTPTVVSAWTFDLGFLQGGIEGIGNIPQMPPSNGFIFYFY